MGRLIIHDDYPAHEGRYSNAWNSCDYIVIHYAASGTESGKRLAQSLHNNGGISSSWHFSVGIDGIWQSLPCRKTAWHCGYSAATTTFISNSEAIGIEVCNDGGAFDDREIEYLKQLVPYLMKEYEIPIENVVRHYDCTYPRKLCPEGYCGSEAKNKRWYELRKYITTSEPEFRDICVYTSNGNANQKWIMNRKGAYYEIESKAYPGWVLDCQYAGTEKGTKVILFPRNGNDNQLWEIVYEMDDPNIHFAPKHCPNMRLDITGAKDMIGTLAELWEKNDSCAQDFVMLENNDETVTLIYNSNGKKLCLDVYGG